MLLNPFPYPFENNPAAVKTYQFQILGSNIFERHNFLLNTIGVLPEEIEAQYKVVLLIYVSYLSLILLSLVDVICFNMYNSRYHPFKYILISEDTEEIEMNQLQKGLSTSQIFDNVIKSKDSIWSKINLFPRQLQNIVNGCLHLSDKPKIGSTKSGTSLFTYVSKRSK